MSLPKMTTAVNNISQLDTRPNAVNGLTADELKAEFDKGPEAIKKFLNEVLIPALDSAITLDALGAVPETRKVNGQALSADVTVSAEDVPAFGPDQLKRTTQFLLDELADGVSKAVPKTRRVAGKTLDADIALAAEDVGYSKTVGGVTTEGTVKTELNSLNAAMDGKVPTTRKVAGKALSADVELDASDIDYAGAISGAANVKAALDALNARKDVAVFSATLSGETLSSAATFPEISAAYSAGKQVLLKVLASDGAYWLLPLVRLLGGMVASFAAWVSNSRLAVATLNYSAASTPPVNAWSLTQVPLSAESVAYSGKVGSGTVANVKAALDGLAVGKPLDMTADYVASGAESVGQWIAMAATGSTTEYRVPCGTFLLRAVAGIYGMTIVTVFEEPDGNWRGAIDIKFTCDCDWEIRFWQGATVGQTPDVAATFQVNNSGDLSLEGANNLENLVPVGNELQKGKFLMCNASGGAEWASLPTYDGGVS